MSESFYFQIHRNYPVLIIGRVGKTILNHLIAAIFQESIAIENKNMHISTIKDLIQLKNTAYSTKSNFSFSLNIEKFEKAEELIEVLVPKIIIITNIGDNHLTKKSSKTNYYSYIENYLLNLPANRLIILNKDDDLVAEIEEKFPDHQYIRFGLNQSADFFAKNIQQLGPNGISFFLNDRIPINIDIYEFYQIYNVLAAIALARCFNIPIQDIISRIKQNFEVPSGRGNLVKIGSINILNDTLHNSQQSVITAAQTLVTFKNFANKSIMVIDKVDVSGKDVNQIHENLGHFLSALPLDIIITIGEEAQYIGKGIELIQNRQRTVIHTDSVEEAVMNLILFLEENDSIMLKSNRDSGLTKFIDIMKKM